MAKSLKNPHFDAIPTTLTHKQFNQFILPYLSKGKRGPKPSISLYKLFCYILRVLYTGMQWHMLEIDKKSNGEPELHYTRIFKKYNRWANDGSLEKIELMSKVVYLSTENLKRPC